MFKFISCLLFITFLLVNKVFAQTEGIIGYSRSEMAPMIRTFSSETGWSSVSISLMDQVDPAVIQHIRMAAAPSFSPRPGWLVMAWIDNAGNINYQIRDSAGNWRDYGKQVLNATGLLGYGFVDCVWDSSGNAIVVYSRNTTTTNQQLGFVVWYSTSASWSSPGIFGYGTTATARWVRLERPSVAGTNRLICVVQFDNSNVVSWFWTPGTGWSSANTFGVNVENNINRNFDVCFTSLTARIFIGNSDDAISHYVWWATSTAYGTGPTLPDLDSGTDICRVIRAVADPLHPDRCIVGKMDNGNDIGVAVWENGSWKTLRTTTPNTGDFSLQDAILETTAQGTIVSYLFDIVWQQVGTNRVAVLAWPRNNVQSPFYKIYTPGTGWSSDFQMPSVGANLRGLQLFCDPSTNDIFAVAVGNDGMLKACYGGNTGGSINWNIAGGFQVISYGITRPSAYSQDRFAFAMSAGNTLAYGGFRTDLPVRYYSGLGGWFSSEDNLPDFTGVPRHVVIRSAPTRNEKILGAITSAGYIEFFVYNGDTDQWGNKTNWPLPSPLPTGADQIWNNPDLYRGFDIAYERNSGRAIVVIQVNAGRPYYNIWNGTNWLGWQEITNWPTDTTTRIPYWIRLEANPNPDSNQILCVAACSPDLQQTAPTTDTVYLRSVLWNGSSWIIPTTLETGLDTIRTQCFDVAFEKIHPYRAVVVWSYRDSPGTNDSPCYNILISTAPTPHWLFTTRQNFGQDMQPNGNPNDNIWIKVAPHPTTSKFAVGALSDSLEDLSVIEWILPYSFANYTQIDANVVPNQVGDTGNNPGTPPFTFMPFSLAYEHGGGDKLMVVYGDGTAQWPRFRMLTGTGWTAESNMESVGTGITPRLFQLAEDPYSNAMMCVIGLSNLNIVCQEWNGSGWSTRFNPSPRIALTEEGAPPQYQPVNFCYTRDYKAPDVKINYPVNNEYYRTLTIISGTADDDPQDENKNVSGLVRVEVVIQDLRFSSTYYIVGTGWRNVAEASAWNQATGTENWSLSLPEGIFVSGVTYRIKVRAIDRAGNNSTPVAPKSQVDFIFDNTLPTGVVLYPSDISSPSSRSYIRILPGQSLVTISGTASDISPGRIQKAVLRLVCVGSQYKNGFWWNWDESRWQGGYFEKEITPPIPLTSWSWSITISTRAFDEDQTTYYISVQVQDRAGNWQIAASTNTFVIDNTPPQSFVTWPDINSDQYAPITTISGTCWDRFNVFSASIAIRKGDSYWNGSAFVSPTPVWFNVIGTYTWTYPAVENLDNTEYRLYTRCMDFAGNVESVDLNTPKRNYIIDTTLPTSAITTPQNNQWYSSLSQILGTARDGPEIGSIQKLNFVRVAIRRLSDGRYWNWPGWTATLPQWDYQSTPPTPINATFTNWVKNFSDAHWGGVSGSSFTVWSQATDLRRPTNLSENVSPPSGGNTFWWDVTPPTSTIIFPQHLGISGVSPVFYGTYYDAHSGIGPTIGGTVKIKLYAKTGTNAGRWYYAGDWRSVDPSNDDLPSANIWISSWSWQSPMLESGAEYLLVTIAKDRAIPGNYQTEFIVGVSSISFICDSTEPDSYISIPATPFRSQLTQIQGTASDLPQASQVNHIQLEITYPVEEDGSGSPQYVWNGTSWVPYTGSFSTYVVIVGGYPSWVYNVPSNINWQQGVRYRIRSRAVDNVGNIESSLTAGDEVRVFKYDVSFPTSTVTRVTQDGNVVYINSGDYLRNITKIEGTARDFPEAPFGELAAVGIYIEKIDNPAVGYFWDAANSIWRNDIGPVRNTTLITAYGWEFDSSGVNWVTGGGLWSNGGRFRIRTEARDSAIPGNNPPPLGNREKSGVYSNLNFIDIIFDPKPPISRITNIPINGYTNSLPTISGTASDVDVTVSYTPVIEEVRINICKLSPPPVKTYNGTTWVDGEHLGSGYWLSCNFVGYSSGTWTYPAPLGGWEHGATYRIITKAKDKAGNYEVNVDTKVFIYDIYQPPPAEAPRSAILFPQSDYHTNDWSNLVVVSGIAYDNPPIGKVGKVYIVLKQITGGVTYYWNNVTWVSGDVPSNAKDWPEAEAVDGNYDSSEEIWRYDDMPDGSYLWTPNIIYYLHVEARDWAGNYEQERTTVTFVYEIKNPTATIIYPVNNGYISAAGKIQGEALDEYPGKIVLDVSNQRGVWVRIRDLAYPSTYYVAGSWIATSPENAWNYVSYLSPAGTWWILNDTPWQDGKIYEINVRCRDKAGNWQIRYSTSTNVKADFTAPTSTITVPASGGEYFTDTLPTISGTFSDALPGKVGSVKIQIRCIDTASPLYNKYWSKPSGVSGSLSDWVDTPVWLTTNLIYHTSSWWYDATGIYWDATVAGINYAVYCYATDEALNAQTPVVVHTFKMRVTAPQTTITKPAFGDPYFPSNLSYWTPNQLEGTRNAYTTAVYVSVKEEKTGKYWDGSGFNATSEQWLTCDVSVPLQWKYVFTTNPWVDGSSYTVRSRGYGPAGWEEAYYTLPSRKFLYDVTNPNVSVVLPENAKYYRILTTISGTAQDPAASNGLASGISEVKFAIRRQDGASYYYWSVLESSWVVGGVVPDEVHFNTTTFSLGVWSVVISSPIWLDGKQYRIYARAKDKTTTGNFSSIVYNDFIFDVSSPTARITTISNNLVYSQMPIITGTASDPVGPGGNAGKLEQVFVHIKRPAQSGYPLRYWHPQERRWDATYPEENDIYWGTSTIHTPNASFSSWSFESLPQQADMTHGFVYIVRCKAKDQALPSGNTQQLWIVSESSFSIIWDNQPPVCSITSYEDPDANGRINPGSDGWLIQGQAVDTPAGITSAANIRLRISRLEGNVTYYWTGTAWSTTPSEFSPDSYISPNWDYTFSDVSQIVSDQVYRIYVRGIDNAVPPNAGTFGSPVEVIIDTTPPTAVVNLPKDGGYYRSAVLTTISGTALGDLAGLARVRVKIDQLTPTFIPDVVPEHTAQGGVGLGVQVWFSTWQPVGGFVDGRKYRVWVKAFDLAGNEQIVWSSSTFTCDNSAPSAKVIQPDDSINTFYHTLLTISGTATDAVSYIATVTVAIQNLTKPAPNWYNGVDFTGTEQYFLASTAAPNIWYYTGFAGALQTDNVYKIYWRVIDAAGNVTQRTSANPPIYTVTIDTVSPTSTITSVEEGKFYTAVPAIQGTATDLGSNPSKCDKVWIRIVNQAGQYWQPGVGWTATADDETNPYIYVNLDASLPSLPYSWDASAVAWQDGVRYTIYVKSKDRALKSNDINYQGNWQVVFTTVGFTIDRTSPTAAIKIPDPTIPEAVRNYNSIPLITGTAYDAVGGVRRVWVVLKDRTLGYYWTGKYTGNPSLDWTDEITRVLIYNNPNPSAGTVVWSTATPTLTTNRNYHIWVEVEDAAGNKFLVSNVDVGNNVGGVKFMYDTQAPSSFLVYPLANSFFNTQLSQISGTCIDDVYTPGSGISQMRIRIKRIDGQTGTTYYFAAPGWSTDAGSWAEVVVYPVLINDALKIYQWSYSFADWIDNNRYDFHLKSRDNTHIATSPGNWESEVVYSAYFDITKPTSKVTRPPLSSAGYDQAIPTISGTAQDL
ncbi:MAG: hypothetical protein RMJ13_07360, partial [Elusimicrobiota bacterium]|nr:hypothetical protein [Elusimicrobiota bacterium]